jgi:hypothetical protein
MKRDRLSASILCERDAGVSAEAAAVGKAGRILLDLDDHPATWPGTTVGLESRAR